MITLEEETTITATWCDSNGPTYSTNWLPPADGYVRIEIDEALTLSLTGLQALQLLFYLTGDSAIDVESLPTTADNPIAWKNNEGQTVIRIKTYFVGIDEEASERLARLLRRILIGSPFYHQGPNGVDWKKEGF